MKVAIIGAGVSGLSVGRLLNDKADVTIYEKNSNIGGIAKTRIVDDVTYHPIGGHCFNSKNQEVLDFVFNKVLPLEDWHRVERKAKIYFKKNLISYPIEFSIKEIASFDKELAFNITHDFFNASPKEADNLADWFTNHFGKTLTEEYLIPYNRKIWHQEPKNMSPVWVKGKLPIPNKKDFFEGLVSNKIDQMPHAHFYYPNSNDQQTFLNALSTGLRVLTDQPVQSLTKTNNMWLINGTDSFDHVISTMPLNLIPGILEDVPEKVKSAISKLKYNSVTTMLWKTEPVEQTWTYYPDAETIFHRHIHIGNFLQPVKPTYTITECVGKKTQDEMMEAGKKIDYLLDSLDYNCSDHAYVVYDGNYASSKSIVLKYLDEIGLRTLGRFGQWEYFNMDVCIESALNLVKNVRKR